MIQIKPPFLHLWSSVLSLCRLDDLSSWAYFAKALLKFPAACCDCSCHTLFIPFFPHTSPPPPRLSFLFVYLPPDGTRFAFTVCFSVRLRKSPHLRACASFLRPGLNGCLFSSIHIETGVSPMTALIFSGLHFTTSHHGQSCWRKPQQIQMYERRQL